MWSIDTFWFEIALVSMMYALGNILFGHFEEHTPKLRRIGKYILTLILIVGISFYFGRTAAMILLALSILPVIYIHAFSLPKKGINGWTAEPKEKYYELRGWDTEKLYQRDKQKWQQIGYDEDGNPITTKELETKVMEAQTRIEKGQFISHEELKNEIKN